MFKDFAHTINFLFDGTDNLPKEGKRLVRFGLYLTFAGIILALIFSCYWIILAVLGLFFSLFCTFFFRNPKRNGSYADDEIISPANGRVLSVKTENDSDILVIRIFLSIFDVHTQKSPIDGSVGNIKYTKGKFKFANNPKANENERNFIEISSNGRYANVEQITGAIARRISAWVKKDDEIKKGQDIGLIFFGSQVALYLPKNGVRILVKEGQKVESGLTTVALWQK